MFKFRDWIAYRESSAFTRNRRDVALGLKPPAALAGSVHSRSTAHPFEVDSIKKQSKHKRKKK